MARPVRGVLAVEGVQTGDGRVIAAGALEWADLPLPLAWLQDGDQHVDLIEVAPQVGTIDTVTRGAGGEIEWTGSIDDEQEAGAEVCRRMDAGTAPLGGRFGVSIDPDDWEVEIVATDTGDGEEGGIILLASGEGPPPRMEAVSAAAGDPDPGEGGGENGVVLFEDSVDSILERYTRMRIRGATLCAVAAFDGAYCEMASDAAAPPAETPPAPAASSRPSAVAASSSAVAPPAAWFDDPAFGEPGTDDRLMHDDTDDLWGCPLTITDDGRVFGHLALWESCHIGYPDACVTAPVSPSGYAHYMLSAAPTRDGGPVPAGRITVAGGHPDLELSYREALAHYDDTDSCGAFVAAGEDVFGVWVAGYEVPGLDDKRRLMLRSSPLSGDWRPVGAALELIAALSVNVPGFRVPRRALHAAGGRQTALVAAGAAPLARMQAARAEPFTRALAAFDKRLAVLERRTEPLMPLAASAVRDRVRAR